MEVTGVLLRMALTNAVDVLEKNNFKDGSSLGTDTPWGLHVQSDLKDGVYTFMYNIDKEKTASFMRNNDFLFKGPASFTLCGLMVMFDGSFVSYGYKCEKSDDNPTGTIWIDDFPILFAVMRDELDKDEFIITELEKLPETAQTELEEEFFNVG
jgi:hypothetical protein